MDKSNNYENNCKNLLNYNKICLKTNQITKIIILLISVGVLQTRDINIP